jgi:predicted adenylyl cyclase CyaB
VREVELKAVVPDADALRKALHASHAALTFAGEMIDHRYDTADGSLVASDRLLRLRTYRAHDGTQRSSLDWKGPTEFVDGYKVREEISTSVGDGLVVETMLAALGFYVVREIDRDIEMFELEGALLRIERYPRLDTLLEVEGSPDNIEQAIAHTGIPRDAFSSERLLSFVTRYEARCGVRAALSHRELTAAHIEEGRR